MNKTLRGPVTGSGSYYVVIIEFQSISKYSFISQKVYLYRLQKRNLCLQNF